ncbi:MAG: hypothetical protein PVG64_08910, partial [Syntrophobacterales bacterium]
NTLGSLATHGTSSQSDALRENGESDRHLTTRRMQVRLHSFWSFDVTAELDLQRRFCYSLV